MKIKEFVEDIAINKNKYKYKGKYDILGIEHQWNNGITLRVDYNGREVYPSIREVDLDYDLGLVKRSKINVEVEEEEEEDKTDGKV